ncbi:MAG: aminopeptidase N [Planktomarina sp.]
MRDATPQTIYLSDYRQPAYFVEDVHLTFILSPTATRVVSKITFTPNKNAPGPFALDGEHMQLKWAKIDGADVVPQVSSTGLTCDVPSARFVWEAEVEINPQDNTALEGLYMSNGMYCTQCEAEGFRRITYYPDRPDVMAPFTVRIEGDLPILLSNGNLIDQGNGWSEWHDPWPKPAYLFALVAGDLHAHKGRFTTMDGRDVELNIYVRDGDQDKCDFAMQALKASMVWDEKTYGRAYDLDVFNIVAVDDFNMGAMENKGLNIFNSSAVLANPATSTDQNFERIEAIIAHEYFHNWTGNRITCRDWFQLCLKEGLTVFRDQQFSADMRSAPVRRIEDVLTLRARQFREDAGPLAHPVRPESFVEINNFYTATVYEKGAEIIGMLRRSVGPTAYAKALQLYFERHDGQACTIEDWLAVFEDVTGRDLRQFKKWYSQAGTPRLSYEDSFEGGTYTITFTQTTPPTPGQNAKDPLVIPIALGLLDRQGTDLIGTQVLEMTEAVQSFTFEGLAHKPFPSILRGFSAPVILDHTPSQDDLLFQMAHDSDAFNAWEAGRALGRKVLLDLIQNGTAIPAAYLKALAGIAENDALDPALRALRLAAPSQDELAASLHSLGKTPDPTAIYDTLDTLRHALAETLQDSLPALYAAHRTAAKYVPDAKGSGGRALANTALALLSRLDGGAAAQAQFDTAQNMTDKMAALGCLIRLGKAGTALQSFYDTWRHERLVIDKWFSTQVANAAPKDASGIANALADHPDFTLQNPNRFRALFGALASSPAAFHDPSGSAYDLMVDQLIQLDDLNPQLTARMTTVFETWRRYDAGRQGLIQTALQRLKDKPNLSRDTHEMLARIMGD